MDYLWTAGLLRPKSGGAGVIAPVADFSADDTTPDTVTAVQFTDLSTNTPSSWDWDFGDGTAHSTSQNPTHTYSTPGIYTVVLIATNSAGSDTETKADYISAGFLVRDEFTVDRAAGAVNGTAAEPGPGTRAVVDAENKLSITGAALVCAGGKAAPAYGDPEIKEDSVARATGLAVFIKIAITTNNFCLFGWSTGTQSAHMFRNPNTTAVWMSNATLYTTAGTHLSGNTYPVIQTRYSVVLRSAGALMLMGNKLLYIFDAGTTNPVLPAVVNNNGQWSLDSMRVVQLPAPFTNDYGLATQRLAGARSAGDTFTHEANCLIQFTVTTRPSATQIEIRFRIQDATNYWQVTIDSSGNVDLDEVVAGTPTQRGTYATIPNGTRIVIRAEGNSIYVYTAESLRFTYASAVNFASETDGELETEGTGGSVSDIVSWPIALSAAVQAILGDYMDPP